MTIDPLAQEIAAISVGLAAGVSAVLKFLPAFMTALRTQKHEANGTFTKYQELQVREIVRVATEESRLVNEATLADMRKLITDRMDAIHNEIKNKRIFVRSEHPDPYYGPERRGR